MLNEIGSEFWETEINSNLFSFSNTHHRFLLSGRTALDFIIKDILCEKKIKSVYMPSYCCHSMLQPFLENDISVEFYDVSFFNGKYEYKLNFDIECEAIFILQYFGFENNFVDEAIYKFKEKNKIIIEDATHSCFLDIPYSRNSDYIFISYRKWTSLPCGAISIKQFNDFSIISPKSTNEDYIKLRQKAALLKRQYIEKNIGQKSEFLNCFSMAEKKLEIDYKYFTIPKEIKENIKKLDIEKIKSKRKANAKYLIESLLTIPKIKTINITKNDVPLFVPVIVQNGKRDELRSFLINNSVYCPVHWTKTDEHKINDTYLYENCLSIVCDQRYSILNMENICRLIAKFFEEER